MLTKTRICIGVIALMLTGVASAGMKVMSEHELNSITGQAFIKVNYDMVANFAEDVAGYRSYWHAIYDSAIEGTVIKETIDPKIVTPVHDFYWENIYINVGVPAQILEGAGNTVQEISSAIYTNTGREAVILNGLSSSLLYDAAGLGIVADALLTTHP